MVTSTSTCYSFPSPAKLNLFLHIVGQRSDGYHELETLFQFLDYGDTISIEITKNNNIELLTPIEGVENEDNLIIKAARLLKSKINKHPSSNTEKNNVGAKIAVNKILPMGGGLGGGSSNAATVLLALNTLWKSNFSLNELAELGLSLGADVPIFIHGFAAFAQGVGEKLTPVTPTEYWYLVSKPNCSISTAKVFTAKDLPRNSAKLRIDEENVDLCDIDSFHNDCQTLVIKHYAEVAKLLAWLVEYAPSRMTGTGACIFSRFTSKEEACIVQAKLPADIDAFVAKGLNQSPLVDAINIVKKAK